MEKTAMEELICRMEEEKIGLIREPNISVYSDGYVGCLDDFIILARKLLAKENKEKIE